MNEADPRERVLKLIADVCLKKDGRDRLRDLEALLDEHAITGEDRDVLLAEGQRIGVYRTLVRNNIANVLCRAFPRTRRLLNANVDDAFDDAVVAFLDAGGTRDTLLRNAPEELVQFLRTCSFRERLPHWAMMLAEYELALFTLDAAPPTEHRGSNVAPDLDARIELAHGARALTLSWPFTELDAESDDTRLPPKRDASFVLSRDAEGVVWTTTTDALTVDVVRALADGATLGEAVQRAARESDAALTPDMLTRIAETLSLLASRGAFARITKSW